MVQSRMGPNPISYERRRDIDTEEKPCDDGGGIRGTRPQPRSHRKLEETLQHLDLRLLTSRTVREYSSVVSSQPVVVICSSSCRKVTRGLWRDRDSWQGDRRAVGQVTERHRLCALFRGCAQVDGRRGPSVDVRELGSVPVLPLGVD